MFMHKLWTKRGPWVFHTHCEKLHYSQISREQSVSIQSREYRGERIKINRPRRNNTVGRIMWYNSTEVSFPRASKPPPTSKIKTDRPGRSSQSEIIAALHRKTITGRGFSLLLLTFSSSLFFLSFSFFFTKRNTRGREISNYRACPLASRFVEAGFKASRTTS